MFQKTSMLLENAIKNKILPPIETFICPFSKLSKSSGIIRITFPEFTCVCPKTGYPDFASIDLYYLPDKKCIELKSWKLFLNSFRMIGCFHEAVTSFLFDTVKNLIKPKWLVLVGDFFPRGNVNTTIVFEYGKRPKEAIYLIKDYKPHCKGFDK
jgi:7-cyano-7-deazaguanine reductase